MEHPSPMQLTMAANMITTTPYSLSPVCFASLSLLSVSAQATISWALSSLPSATPPNTNPPTSPTDPRKVGDDNCSTASFLQDDVDRAFTTVGATLERFQDFSSLPATWLHEFNTNNKETSTHPDSQTNNKIADTIPSSLLQQVLQTILDHPKYSANVDWPLRQHMFTGILSFYNNKLKVMIPTIIPTFVRNVCSFIATKVIVL